MLYSEPARYAFYNVTMIVLASLIGRTIPPAADGQPYEKQ